VSTKASREEKATVMVSLLSDTPSLVAADNDDNDNDYHVSSSVPNPILSL